MRNALADPRVLPAEENLRILSLARNNIKKISGLDELAESLEELWLSYNQIEKLAGLSALKKLRVLYIGNNRIKGADELNKLVRRRSRPLSAQMR